MAGARGGATRAAGRVLFALAVLFVVTLTWTPKVAGDASSPATVVASSSSVDDERNAGPRGDAHAHGEAIDTHAHGHAHGHEEHSHAAHASSTSMQKDHEHTHSHQEHSREQQQHSHSHGHHGDDGGHSHGHGHGYGHKHDHNHGHGHGHGHDDQGKKSLQDSLQRGLAYAHEELAHHSLATKAIGATLLVTFGGNAVILLFLKLELSKSQLNVMVAFAVGGLLGDVFLHLLPHALESHGQHGHAQDHGHGHGHGDDAQGHEEHGHEHDLTVGLAVLAGILCFFVVEKLLRVAGGSGTHGHAHHSHDHLVARKKKDDDADLGAENATSAGAAAAHGPPLILGLRPGAILNMVADTVHNFTDGMALAAAFQASDAIGLTMTIAVLVHEVPHEVGDFSVLVSQGLSKWGALRAQFVSALGALAGCGFGLAVSSSQPAAILSFTAGGFIYIALVSIVPELLEEPATVSNTILQTLAACCGIYMMIVIADLEAASHAH